MIDNGHKHHKRFGDPPYGEPNFGARATDAAGSGEKKPTGPDAAKRVLEQVVELKEHLAYLASVKLDAMKLSLRRLAIYAALGLLGAIAGLVAICLAVTQVLYGLGDGLGLLLWENYWAGHLIVGALVLTGAIITPIIAMRRMTSASREATLHKYEARKSQQKADYGRDIQQTAHGETTR